MIIELTVLITHVSYQAATGSLIKMLRNSNKYKCRIIGCDSIPKGYSSGSMLVDKFIHLPNKTSSMEYISSIRSICTQEEVDLILSAEEEDLLAFRVHNISQFMCESIADPSIFELFQDKYHANCAIASNSLLVPKTITCTNEYINSSKEKFIYRKRVSCCSRGIKAFYRNEINNDYSFFSKEHITQEFIAGEMFDIDVLCDKDGIIHLAIPRKSISEKDGTTFKCIIKRDEELMRICKKIYSIYKIPGISNIQFIVENNRAYFIELNLRYAATIIASSIASVNILDLFISHFLFNETLPEFSVLVKTVKWDSVIARYYQETILYGSVDNANSSK